MLCSLLEHFQHLLCEANFAIPTLRAASKIIRDLELEKSVINPLSGAISMLTPNLRDRIKIVHGSFVVDQSERSKASQSWLRKPSQSCYLCDLPCYPSQRLQLCEGSLRVSRIVSAISDLLTPKSLRKDDFRRCWKCSIAVSR